MFNVKLKTVFKVIGCLSAVVIICSYLQGKYKLFGDPDELSEKIARMTGEVLQTEFEIFGRVQGSSWIEVCLR